MAGVTDALSLIGTKWMGMTTTSRYSWPIMLCTRLRFPSQVTGYGYHSIQSSLTSHAVGMSPGLCAVQALGRNGLVWPSVSHKVGGWV